MGACRIQCVLLLSLLGFCPCSDTLTCHEGSMMKFGKNFTKEAIVWIVDLTVSDNGDRIMCHETLLLIDVKNLSYWGAKASAVFLVSPKNVQVFSAGPGIVAASYVHFCDTNGCNRANSTSILLESLSLSAYNEPGTTKCPVCLDFKGSCSLTSNLVLCPMETKCYASSLRLQGGSLSAFLNIFGCLNSSYQFLLNNQSSIGIINMKETLELMTSISSSHVLVLSPLLAWVLGLKALLSPMFTEICPLC